ncbi:hypothetical protein T10_7771 [Trichinella papuae]|uniref:Uncharacterized protein n=1 Tax=Trichinella papuae TaxID=268474 RepID=A0A0V1MPV2_9BILA|nr:hypothetical protein T10_7771 [Trichinella papuae]
MKITKLNTPLNMRKIEFNILSEKRKQRRGLCLSMTDPAQPVSQSILDACYCCTLTLPVYVVKNTSVPG